MKEQHRHQRIRFNALLPPVRIGPFGFSGSGERERLSLGGLLLRSELPLKMGETIGCALVVFDSPLINISAVVVSRIGHLHGARFQAGPISECLIEAAIDQVLVVGKASILSINDLRGRKVMRIAGGLNGALRNDCMHSLTRMGANEFDSIGIELCRIAFEPHRVRISAHRRACGPR